jgi:hypothetical protein
MELSENENESSHHVGGGIIAPALQLRYLDRELTAKNWAIANVRFWE